MKNCVKDIGGLAVTVLKPKEEIGMEYQARSVRIPSMEVR